MAERNLKITFNVVADLCRTHSERVRRLAAAGHEIACHGWKHERPRGLDEAAIDRMLSQAATCFGELGLTPIGFRSPESAWSVLLLRRLTRFAYRWNAEGERFSRRYRIAPDLVRLPVRTDDWDLADGTAAPPTLANGVASPTGRDPTGAVFASVSTNGSSAGMMPSRRVGGCP
jgi:peptidoglycan/xylan/chitin deacetylase (PgdA/CDA1 family)